MKTCRYNTVYLKLLAHTVFTPQCYIKVHTDKQSSQLRTEAQKTRTVTKVQKYVVITFCLLLKLTKL